MKARQGKIAPKHLLVLSQYSEPVLGEVVTMAEATYLWNMSRNAVKNACLTNKVASRLSITGGTWLISVVSMTEVYGRPHKEELSWLKS